MKPYGRRDKIKCTIQGHGNCLICHPEDVDKNRARKESLEKIKEQVAELNDDQTPYYPPCCRASTLVRRLYLSKDFNLAVEIEQTAYKYKCAECEKSSDPIVGLSPENQIILACPFCSGENVRKIWELEIEEE